MIRADRSLIDLTHTDNGLDKNILSLLVEQAPLYQGTGAGKAQKLVSGTARGFF